MTILDVLGIGFGPANIAVAIANEELGTNLSMLFFEKSDSSAWQPGMQFGQSDIQNHPLRDLVTPRNPRSQYSFTNFLHSQGRLYEFLNLGKIFPLRSEYSQYVEWVAKHFSESVLYRTEIASINLVSVNNEPLYKLSSRSGQVYFGRSLIVAPGRTAYLPAPFRDIASPNVVHLTRFIPTLRAHRSDSLRKIAVVGSSQSAAEIMLYLANEYPCAEVTGFVRGFGYRMKDVSPFTGEVYFPKFVDTYYACTSEQKRAFNSDLRFTNYSSTDADVLDALYLKMYQQKVENRELVSIERSSRIVSATQDHQGSIVVSFSSVEKPALQTAAYDLVILATGFRNIGPHEDEEKFPPLLADLMPHIETDNEGVLEINKDYSLRMINRNGAPGPCYLNGLCESSHGMGDAGSFSMLALRSETIIRSLKEGLAARTAAGVAPRLDAPPKRSASEAMT